MYSLFKVSKWQRKTSLKVEKRRHLSCLQVSCSSSFLFYFLVYCHHSFPSKGLCGAFSFFFLKILPSKMEPTMTTFNDPWTERRSWSPVRLSLPSAICIKWSKSPWMLKLLGNLQPVSFKHLPHSFAPQGLFQSGKMAGTPSHPQAMTALPRRMNPTSCPQPLKLKLAHVQSLLRSGGTLPVFLPVRWRKFKVLSSLRPRLPCQWSVQRHRNLLWVRDLRKMTLLCRSHLWEGEARKRHQPSLQWLLPRRSWGGLRQGILWKSKQVSNNLSYH